MLEEKKKEALNRLREYTDFLNVHDLGKITTQERLHYMRIESYLEGYIEAAKLNPMRLDSSVQKLVTLLEQVRERRQIHERVGKKV